MAFMGRMVVGALAWVWTRVFTERVRVRTMWLLNEKVAVRVVGIVRGPDGAILMVADPSGRWTLPGVLTNRNHGCETTCKVRTVLGRVTGGPSRPADRVMRGWSVSTRAMFLAGALARTLRLP